MRQNQPFFSTDDLARIVDRTFVENVLYIPELPSTNDRALELSAGEVPRLPTLVLVDQQTAGRGRGTNRWWSTAGALTFSLLFDTSSMQIKPAVWPKISLAAGLAVCEALESLLDGCFLKLKWPNDVLADERKVCGILAEAPPHCKDLMVLGIGVNVNNRLAEAPDELKPMATSMLELAGQGSSLCDVLITILEHLAEKLQWITEQPEELRLRWQERCLLTGRTIEIELPDRCLCGTCRGIDNDGALLLDTATGQQRCLSGVIKRWA